MPVPKRRTSKRVKKQRRSHDALTAPQWSTCANCGETTNVANIRTDASNIDFKCETSRTFVILASLNIRLIIHSALQAECCSFPQNPEYRRLDQGPSKGERQARPLIVRWRRCDSSNRHTQDHSSRPADVNFLSP